MDRGKSRSLFLVLVFGVALLIPTPGFAQVYVGGYVGAAIPHDADTSIPNLAVSDTEFDAGVMVGGRVGYWLEALDLPFLGVEVEVYGAFPEISDQTVPIAGAVTGTIQEADFDVLTVAFNVLARYPYGPIQPYGGVGVGILTADTDDWRLAAPAGPFPAGTVLVPSDDDTAAALQLIGGVRGFLTDNVAVFGEYKWVTTELEFQSPLLGNIELDYSASHVYGGIEFYFGPGVQQQP